MTWLMFSTEVVHFFLKLFFISLNINLFLFFFSNENNVLLMSGRSFF